MPQNNAKEWGYDSLFEDTRSQLQKISLSYLSKPNIVSAPHVFEGTRDNSGHRAKTINCSSFPAHKSQVKSILVDEFQAFLPFLSIYILCGCSCSDGSHNAPNKAWHAVEVVDATCVLDVQPGLQNRLKGREAKRSET